jgi:outer membrane protein assembly factor BamB
MISGALTKPAGFAVSLAFLLVMVPGFATAQSEWLTWGHDPERSGSNPDEKILNKDNVSQLEVKWTAQISTAPKEYVLSTMTAPVVAAVNTPQGPVARLFVVGSDNTVFAIDAATGKIAWQKASPNTIPEPKKGDYRCPNTQNATPVIDKSAGIIYVSTSDGKLRGMSLLDGEDRIPPTNFTDPFARNWSLNLIDGVIYSPTARGCLDMQSHFTALDLNDPVRHALEYYTNTGITSGAWGRGGLVRGPKGILAQTADGPYDPASGKFGNTVVALTARNFRMQDTFTPANWEYLNKTDLDLGSANPVVFPFQKWTLVTSAGKESVINLLDANNLGGVDHHTPLYTSPRLGNDEAKLHDRGIWGMTTWQDPRGRRWLYLPMLGPPAKDAPKFPQSYGPADQGSIMAFEVRLDEATNKPTLAPMWISRDMHAPEPPTVANGVVYGLLSGKTSDESRGAIKAPAGVDPNAVLYALDAETGRELYSSNKLIPSFTHFNEPVVAGGQVYICTWDGKVYAFGLKSSRPSTESK